MASYNRVILVGNLTRDVELRYTPNETPVTDIGLAVNDRVKRQGEWVDEATFVDITLWGRTAEIASQYLSKGSPVLIEGRLKFESWEQDGQKRSKLKVVGERMQMLGGGGNRGNAQAPHHASSQPASSQAAAAASAPANTTPPPDDEVPF